MSYTSELAECREAMRKPPVSDWFKALRGEPTPAVEPTPSLDELFDRPGKATRDWYEVIGVAGSMELWPPGWAEDRLDEVELDAQRDHEEYLDRLVLEEELAAQADRELLIEPEIVNLSDDPLIMGVLAGTIRTICLDCAERDCPAHPVNGIV